MDEKRKKIKSIKDKTSKVGIIFGGTPGERPYAERSAIDISQALKTLGYNPIRIDFDKNFMNKINRVKIDLAFLIDATFMGTIDEYERFLNGRSLRQILEELNIPYTGSLLSAAETTKNKIASKVAFLKAGLSTAPYKEIYYEKPVKQQTKTISG